MGEEDLPQVMQMEKEAFSEPWNEAFFRECFRFADCRVLERGDVVQAYGVMLVEAAQAHIVNLCVRAQSRRRGLGRQMVTHLLERARSSEARLAFLEVRSSNQAALSLYQSMGFHRLGVNQAYYRTAEGREDALILFIPL